MAGNGAENGGNQEFFSQARREHRRKAAQGGPSSRRRRIRRPLPAYSGWNEVVAGTSDARSSAPIGIMPFSVR